MAESFNSKDYSDYIDPNRKVDYSAYLAERINKNIEYSDYIVGASGDMPIQYADYIAASICEPDDINNGSNFPIVQQMSARTIGLDLVAVQPLSVPVGNLMYMDYVYTGDGIFEYKEGWHKDKRYDADEFFNDDTFNEY